ncbi:L-rhamnose mutarotase [Pedobacter africanus]|uniref:L-rhamnose mutarotase n=1 Tax=Pedobacter africanus TaxID=151894 RepID=A0ACC6KYM9_9SPHI|nr:L-rhamnose mutarotase [Pedobacter africanus]MDR6784480.1 L-rhamnose mutarotase [Pedobacter africanus]
MERLAFKMTLLPGCAAAYKKRHEEIWPEISALLKTAGVSDYSIYLDVQTDTLFATMKIADRRMLDALADEKVMRQWWNYMSDMVLSNADGIPVLTNLTELFHLS